MAAVNTKVATSVQLKYVEGKDSKGQDIIKSMKFSGIKPASADDDVLTVGTSIGSLLQYAVSQVLRVDQDLLANS